MEAGRVIRAARQQAGVSQRELAARAGVGREVVERIESGRTRPRWDTVVQLLEAVELGVALALPEGGVTDELVDWLYLSTSHRLYLSLGCRPNHRWDLSSEPWCALARLARGRAVVLSPEASVGVWLPGRRAPSPLPVTAVTGPDCWGRPLVPEPGLDVDVGPRRLEGLVQVGVSAHDEVWVHPPDAPQLATDVVTSAQLRTVAAVLDGQQRKDAQHRRPAAHKDSRVRWEQGWVITRKATAGRPDPDPRERRDWRLGGEASFREWKALRGYAVPDLKGSGAADHDEQDLPEAI